MAKEVKSGIALLALLFIAGGSAALWEGIKAMLLPIKVFLYNIPTLLEGLGITPFDIVKDIIITPYNIIGFIIFILSALGFILGTFARRKLYQLVSGIMSILGFVAFVINI